MKKLIIVAMVLCLALTIVGCGKNTSKMLVGKWTAEETYGTEKVNYGFTFNSDETGTFFIQDEKESIPFKWSLTNDTTLTITSTEDEDASPTTLTIDITKTNLTVTSKDFFGDDKPITFTKTK